MKLIDKFENWLNTNPTKEIRAVQCELIADEFAIGFAIWKERNVEQDGYGLYYGESRIQVSRKNPVTIQKLIEIYKKENLS